MSLFEENDCAVMIFQGFQTVKDIEEESDWNYCSVVGWSVRVYFINSEFLFSFMSAKKTKIIVPSRV